MKALQAIERHRMRGADGQYPIARGRAAISRDHDFASAPLSTASTSRDRLVLASSMLTTCTEGLLSQT